MKSTMAIVAADRCRWWLGNVYSGKEPIGKDMQRPGAGESWVLSNVKIKAVPRGGGITVWILNTPERHYLLHENKAASFTCIAAHGWI